MTYGNGDYVDYSYDNYGNVRERSQNGTVTYRAYADNTGAVTREVDESNNVEYNYLYDSTDRLVSKKASYISAASGARSFKSSFSYDYDLNNNVTKFSVLTAKGPITTDYTYGLDNLPLTATFQSGKVLTNTFDKLGRLTKTNLNTNSNIETTYTYLASGYEGDYTTNFVETETNGVFTYKYEYDANGNITKVYRKNGNTYEVSEEYTYNELNELTQVDYLNLNKRYTYSYDSGGNISKEKVYTLNNGTPTYQSSKNYVYGDFNWHDKLTSYGGSAITYDAIGNPLSYRGMTLTWQNGRQLASSSNGSTVTNYTYGADGMRMTKKVGSSTTYYQYFNGLLIQEIKGAKILDYSYDANGQIYAVRYRTNANDEGTYYYYAHNTRGDIVGLYNADGSLHAKYSYDVWGNPLSVTDASNAAITSQTDIANLQSFRYRGYYYDSDSGFYYLQSRYYDPVTHRFINADGLVSTGTGVLGYNMFSYCENNPVGNFDPSGERYDDAFLEKRKAKLKQGGTERLSSNRTPSQRAAQALYNNTKPKYNEDYYYYSVPVKSVNGYNTDFYGIVKYYDTNTIDVLKDLTKLITDDARKKGKGDFDVSPAGEAHLFGEMIFHLEGYIIWDKKDQGSFLSYCNNIDLVIQKDGSVNDSGHGIISTIINRASEQLGYYY